MKYPSDKGSSQEEINGEVFYLNTDVLRDSSSWIYQAKKNRLVLFNFKKMMKCFFNKTDEIQLF